MSGPKWTVSGPARRMAWLALALMLCSISAAAQAAPDPALAAKVQRVLILASYHPGQPWTDALVQGIRDGVTERKPLVEISTEYLDAKRFGQRLFALKSQLLKEKYGTFRQDLLFVCDDDALRFYQQHGGAIWPDTPVVFVGINDQALAASVPRERVTGVTETFSLDPFLETAKRVRPGVRRIFVLNDNTTTGVAMRDTMREYARRHPEREYRFLDGSAAGLNELLAVLAEARRDDLVVASMFTADRARSDYASGETQARIARASAAPVVSPTTSDLGHGYLCGRANNGLAHGRFASSLGVKVLSGVSPGVIPVVQHDIIGLLVDAERASALGIPESAWPSDTLFVNRKPVSPPRDRSLFFVGLAFIIIQTAIIAALVVNRARRQKAERALRSSEELLERAQQLARVGSWVRNLDTGELTWSREVYRLYGLTQGAIQPSLEYVLSRIHPDDADRIQALISRADAKGSDRSMEYRIVNEDGAERHVRINAELHRRPNGHRVVTGTIQDISEIRAMEAQVRQVQKMESVGQLAGGIAHDFNNLLTVINGYSQLLMRRMEGTNPERRKVEEILRAGEKAAALTRQLLAFGRRQMLNSVTVDVAATVQSMTSMLTALLGEAIVLQTHFENPAPVEADPAHLEQVILNLVLNARDAMPSGGRLTISVCTLRVAATEPRDWGVEPGAYTMLTVADTGSGMDEATRAQVFEPFFTTKPTGKGSGLGLSTVYGVVKQSRGHVSVWSKPGVGTEFRAYLPVSSEAATPREGTASPEPVPIISRETVLLVEDQDSVRGLASETLSAIGYRVLEASTGEEGLRLAARSADPVGLVVTDVVMPGMNGPQLAAELRKRTPGIRVLFITGYAGDALGGEKAHLLLKPFLPSELAWKVREILTLPNPGAPPNGQGV